MNMAAFVALGVPVFEIRNAAGMTDMLIRTPELGQALAASLGDKPAVLMRGHGAVVVGASIPESVGRSIYLQMDARLQAQAMALGGEITYLDPEEARKVQAAFGYDRAWELWKSTMREDGPPRTKTNRPARFRAGLPWIRRLRT